MNDDDMNIVSEIMVGMAIRNYQTAEQFYKEVLTTTTGIDGFWTTWENREGGADSNIILAMNSNQIKDASPVTYDDAGKVIPLSERFNASEKDIRFSLRELSDGTSYVRVDTDQQIFDGVQENEYAKVARNYIRDHFRNKVIGERNKAYVRRESENEYTYPAKKNLSSTVYAGKMKAATELPNLLDSSEFISHQDDDGRHPDATRGWNTYKTIFEVDGRFFEGEIKTKL